MTTKSLYQSPTAPRQISKQEFQASFARNKENAIRALATMLADLTRPSESARNDEAATKEIVATLLRETPARSKTPIEANDGSHMIETMLLHSIEKYGDTKSMTERLRLQHLLRLLFVLSRANVLNESAIDAKNVALISASDGLHLVVHAPEEQSVLKTPETINTMSLNAATLLFENFDVAMDSVHTYMKKRHAMPNPNSHPHRCSYLYVLDQILAKVQEARLQYREQNMESMLRTTMLPSNKDLPKKQETATSKPQIGAGNSPR